MEVDCVHAYSVPITSNGKTELETKHYWNNVQMPMHEMTTSIVINTETAMHTCFVAYQRYDIIVDANIIIIKMQVLDCEI